MKKTLLFTLTTIFCSLNTVLFAQPYPMADFDVSMDTVCMDYGYLTDEIMFYDLSIDNENDIVAWNWDFGDGNTSNMQEPTHMYSEPGLYPVTLHVENNIGDISNWVTKEILVVEVNINLSSSSFLCQGECNGSISTYVNGGIEPYTYVWNTAESSSYLTNLCAGYYSLTVTDAYGCVNVEDATVYESDPLELNLISSGCVDSTGFGSIYLQVFGGSAPYFYTWSNGYSEWVMEQAVPGYYAVTVTDQNGCTAAASTQIEDYLCSVNVMGTVYWDENENCIMDVGEEVSNALVKAIPGNYYSYTDYLGNYEFYLNEGTYEIEIVNYDAFDMICPTVGNQTVEIIDVFDTIQNVNIGLQAADNYECNNQNIYTSISPVRPCFNSHIIVNFGNNGSVSLENSTITVELNDYMSYNSSNYTLLENVGNGLTFDVGTITPFESGYLHIITDVDCDLQITGQTACVTAIIQSETPCEFDYGDWDKSSISIEGYCQNDLNACFTLTNTGDFGEGDMQNEHEYRIFANDTLINYGAFQLNGGESMEICWPTSGRAIRLEADQHPEHPGNSHPQDIVENCGDTEGTSLGYIITVPYDDNDPFVSTDCRTITNSFDPNDKLVHPSGITDNHYIDDDYPLSYTINFQNTGTDTAFTVVITDTISSVHNMSTFINGASSHPCELEITGNGILKWTFNDILLPDSTTNESESHGFVSYSIELFEMTEQQYGTEIENTAAIFFDFNPPVITNTTHLVFAELPIVLLTGIKEINKSTQISVYPNPTEGLLSLESETEIAEMRIIDLQGKTLLSQKNIGFQNKIDLRNIAEGMYILIVKTKDNQLYKEKIVIK